MSKQSFLVKQIVIPLVILVLFVGMPACAPPVENGSGIDNGEIPTQTVSTNNDTIIEVTISPQPRAMVNLWVDAVSGNDGNDGKTRTAAFRTIQKAAEVAGEGTTVHILPGVYRENVKPASTGTASGNIYFLAEDGPGTVFIRGSVPSSSLNWSQLDSNSIGLPPGIDPENIYYADISSWGLEKSPRFVIELNNSGEVISRQPLAREPDWQVETRWKHHEHWWAAEGGTAVADCYPPTDSNPRNCDLPSRSNTQLTDTSNDIVPSDIEAGNLTTLGDLTGATIRVIEPVPGHWLYRRTIVSHDVAAGRVTLNNPTGTSLGWGSKYYVAGLPSLLDTPGEWWYDPDSGRIYIWPRQDGNPGTLNIEISRLENGFDLSDRSYITIDSLTIEFFEGIAVRLNNSPTNKTYNVTVRNATLRYANYGLWLTQAVRADSPAENVTDGFILEDSEIAFMDTQAILIRQWWENNAATDSFTRSGITNTTISGNEMHHLGFNADDGSENGVDIIFPDQLVFEGNHIHDVAHNGVQFLRSVIQSPKEYGFEPGEIKIGGILIKDNLFEHTCQLTMDCGGLKFWGAPPDTHVFRDVLITGNVFRNIFGWTYTAEQRGIWSGGAASDVQGMGGFGLYLDYASGIHVYRNISYNNSYSGYMFSGTWRDGDIIYYNNIAANSFLGFWLHGLLQDTHGNFNTQLVNNIILNNEGYGISLGTGGTGFGNLTIDHNLYYNNGWRTEADGGIRLAGAMLINDFSTANSYYQSLVDIWFNSPWEENGLEGNPNFEEYYPADHDLFDRTWPDFHLTASSQNALDRGTATLPDSLDALLDYFDISDSLDGNAYEIGRYEVGNVLKGRTIHP